MTKLFQIEQACKDNNYELVKHLLDSLDSPNLKREAFERIIEYYENKSSFPVGYSLLFITNLLQHRDLTTAMNHIRKCKQIGVAEESISQLVYENLIKPNESYYKENFNKNVQLLQSNKILFSNLTFDFEDIKKDVLTIANYQDKYFVIEGKSTLLLADGINLNEIQRLLEEGRFIYLIYGDLKKFYYMLLFEDLSRLSRYIQEKKIIFFAGRDMDNIQGFFANMMLTPPDYYIDLSKHKDYRNIAKEILRLKNLKLVSYVEEVNAYYKNKDCQYYQNLFSRDTSDIKVLLITSRNTTINQYICRNWYNAFVELGYTAKLLIENEPYESMHTMYIWEQMYEFKPDIVFHINFTVGSVLKEYEIKKNLLWIMRYRDKTDISYANKGYDYGNMFVLPMNTEWKEELIDIGIPSNRILYTIDGVNINVFTKKSDVNEKYACDVVTVNNAGGGEFFTLKLLLDKIDNNEAKQVIHELYADLIEMAHNEEFIFFYNSFNNLITDKFLLRGMQITADVMRLIASYFSIIMLDFYRVRVIEWIMDSGITQNIKVWGKWWSNIEKFRDIHMGVAKHGKQLAKIYRSSKIALSEHPHNTLHERNFEILASGGFPLIKNTEPENNETIDNITNYFKENEEVVLFYSKDDLLNKIQYYLDNPEERERVAENGRKLVIKDFSSIAIAKRTMEFIRNYYLYQV